jgi:hypothetical protein
MSAATGADVAEPYVYTQVNSSVKPPDAAIESSAEMEAPCHDEAGTVDSSKDQHHESRLRLAETQMSGLKDKEAVELIWVG